MDNLQVKTLCKIRDLYRSISEFELKFQESHDISLNEGMLLCTLSDKKLSSSEIAEVLGLTNSNASKVIKSVEKKGLVERTIGEHDKRQMYFVLSEKGSDRLTSIKCQDIDGSMPETLSQVLQ